MKYVGFCGPKISKPTEWGDGDRVGTLLAQFPDGWRGVGGHYSSSLSYAEGDIRYKFERREDPSDADTYEWIGEQSDSDALMAKYPPAPKQASDD